MQKCYDKFAVSEIKIENKKIVYLKIVNVTKKIVVFETGKKITGNAQATPKAQPKQEVNSTVADALGGLPFDIM